MSRISNIFNKFDVSMNVETDYIHYRRINQILPEFSSFAMRMKVSVKLTAHDGCVNSLSWSPNGDLLVSGSDDCRINLWKTETNKLMASFRSGHSANIFSVKFLDPSTRNKLVSCDARGDVIYHKLERIPREGNERTELAQAESGKFQCNSSMTYMVASDPRNENIFYSCSDEGRLLRYDVRVRTSCICRGKTYLCTKHQFIDYKDNDITGIPAFDICQLRPYMFLLGTNDDKVSIFDSRMQKMLYSFMPKFSTRKLNTRITDIRFDLQDPNYVLVNYHAENILLLRPNSGNQRDLVQTYTGHMNKKTLIKESNFFANNVILGGSDDGYVYLWNRKSGELVNAVQADGDVVNCVQPHPTFPIFAASGIDSTIKIVEPIAQSKNDNLKEIVEENTRRNFHGGSRTVDWERVLELISENINLMTPSSDSE